MIHFIRDKDNNTIVDAEALPNDLHVVVSIDYYSKFLLGVDAWTKKADVIADFNAIQELRGAWFETGPGSGSKPDPDITTDDFVGERVRALADKYGLSYVTD